MPAAEVIYVHDRPEIFGQCLLWGSAELKHAYRLDARLPSRDSSEIFSSSAPAKYPGMCCFTAASAVSSPLAHVDWTRSLLSLQIIFHFALAPYLVAGLLLSLSATAAKPPTLAPSFDDIDPCTEYIGQLGSDG